MCHKFQNFRQFTIEISQFAIQNDLEIPGIFSSYKNFFLQEISEFPEKLEIL